MRELNSTVWRIVALHGIAIAAASVLLPLILADRLHATARDYEQRLLRDRIALISHTLTWDAAGRAVLPPGVAETVRGDGSFAFWIIDGRGRTLLSSGAVPARPKPGQDANDPYFEARSTQGSFIGMSVPARVAGTDVFIEVAQNLDFRDVVLDDVESVYVSHLAWQIGAVLLALFTLDVLVVRAALGPIRRASTDAQTIDTARLDVRLGERGLPSDVRPLVQAINKALDRLERGFQLQRDFAADVAHELRTPLSIMRLRVDALGDRRSAEPLLHDIEVMRRVIDQLLALAELEAVPPDAAVADLGVVAERVVRHLAPAAIACRRELALVAGPQPNRVRAAPDAVFQALRNLVENALQHTPEGTAVEVRVERGGAVHVIDAGPGVPEAERELIFQRFWRRDRQQGSGAGLGLAIATRIAGAAGGSVGVQEAPGGGADFVLRLPTVDALARKGA
jgi:signal transduction histidine kinase